MTKAPGGEGCQFLCRWCLASSGLHAHAHERKFTDIAIFFPLASRLQPWSDLVLAPYRFTLFCFRLLVKKTNTSTHESKQLFNFYKTLSP